MVKELIVGDAINELAATRRILDRLPEEHMRWRPHAKSMTLGGLATHLANHDFSLSGIRSFDHTASAKASGEPQRRAGAIRRKRHQA